MDIQVPTLMPWELSTIIKIWLYSPCWTFCIYTYIYSIYWTVYILNVYIFIYSATHIWKDFYWGNFTNFLLNSLTCKCYLSNLSRWSGIFGVLFWPKYWTVDYMRVHTWFPVFFFISLMPMLDWWVFFIEWLLSKLTIATQKNNILGVKYPNYLI